MRALHQEHDPVEITHLTDGDETFEYLDAVSDSTRPDLVLLDLRIPKRDGLEVLQRIRASTELAQLPVVILSTSSAESDVARAYGYRANSYVVKPTDFAELTRAVQAIKTYWTTWNVTH